MNKSVSEDYDQIKQMKTILIGNDDHRFVHNDLKYDDVTDRMKEQIVEIQISHDGDFLRVEERNADLYASVDLALDRAERQLRKEKEKRVEKTKENSLKGKIVKVKILENHVYSFLGEIVDE